MAKKGENIPKISGDSSKRKPVCHREWPTIASEARDRTSELARQGAKGLKKLLNGERFSEAEFFRVNGISLALFLQIIRLMEAMGAKTDPVSETFWDEGLDDLHD